MTFCSIIPTGSAICSIHDLYAICGSASVTFHGSYAVCGSASVTFHGSYAICGSASATFHGSYAICGSGTTGLSSTLEDAEGVNSADDSSSITAPNDFNHSGPKEKGSSSSSSGIVGCDFSFWTVAA